MQRMGVWMWMDLPARYGARQVTDLCAEAGVTDLFFLVKGLKGTVACKPLLPGMEPAYPGRDLLSELLEAAHARGLRVHAWLTSASDGLYKASHPESGLVHFLRGRDRDIVSMTDEPYARFMEDFVAALARAYAVDGLHLDYIRYNHMAYGWSEDDLTRYASAGADPECLRQWIRQAFFSGSPSSEDPEALKALLDAYRAGDPSLRAFAAVRRQNVKAFAKRIIAAARSARPGLPVSAALMPEGAYEDTAFSDLHYGQSHEDAAELYNLVLPMAYSQAYHENADWIARVARGEAARGLHTLVGLHAYEGGTGRTLAADARAVAALEDPRGLIEGIALFRAGTVAYAGLDGRKLWIRNALEVPILRLEAYCGGEVFAINLPSLSPGECAQATLPFAPEALGAWTASGEAAVLLRPTQSN